MSKHTRSTAVFTTAFELQAPGYQHFKMFVTNMPLTSNWLNFKVANFYDLVYKFNTTKQKIQRHTHQKTKQKQQQPQNMHKKQK